MKHDTASGALYGAALKFAKYNPKLSSVETMTVEAVRVALAGKLRGENLKIANGIVDGGVENAHDTVFAERAVERSEWSWIFKSSMETLLSAEPYNRNARVVAAFYSINVRA
jgi:hypothetical protein